MNAETRDPVRQALVHGEASPGEWSGWAPGDALRRLRLRLRLTQRQLAAKAGCPPSLVCRAEKGADVRLGTLRRLYEALGCRMIVLPAGALKALGERRARLDREWLEWKRQNARYLRGVASETIPVCPDTVKIAETQRPESGRGGRSTRC